MVQLVMKSFFGFAFLAVGLLASPLYGVATIIAPIISILIICYAIDPHYKFKVTLTYLGFCIFICLLTLWLSEDASKTANDARLYDWLKANYGSDYASKFRIESIQSVAYFTSITNSGFIYSIVILVFSVCLPKINKN